MSDIAICINCGRTDADAPVVSLRFQGHPFWACTQCMPVVIHKTEQIADKLAAILRETRKTIHG